MAGFLCKPYHIYSKMLILENLLASVEGFADPSTG